MYLTEALAGTGGALKTIPEDFVVEEIPAYAPSGTGPHTYLWIEKRGLTTDEAIRKLCAALGASVRDAGSAGMKDRHAVSRQWISLLEADVDAARAVEIEGLRVLEVKRHANKLKTGHLRGNRFTLTVRGAAPEAMARARAILDVLLVRGVLNPFGEQRFGAHGDNADRGARLVRGEKIPLRDGRERRFLISAFQSRLFNRYLEARVTDQLLERALVGDVMKKHDSGGVFVVDEAALADAQARLDARAIAVTGPMFGTEMRAPLSGSPSAEREERLLLAEGLTRESFATVGSLAPGTRRPLTVPLSEVALEAGPTADVYIVKFALPSGTYATEVMKELLKSPLDTPADLA